MTITTQYRRTTDIEAVKVSKHNAREVAAWCGGRYEEEPKASDPTDVAIWVKVPTIIGVLAARVGDYVVKNEQGFAVTQDSPQEAGFYELDPAQEDADTIHEAISQAASGLDFLLQRQRTIEEGWGRMVDPSNPQAVSQYVRDVVLCATDELHEVLAEVHWKPWKDSTGIKDMDKYREEMADVLHFILDLYLAGGLKGSDIVVDYLTKHYENLNRLKSAVYRAS